MLLASQGEINVYFARTVFASSNEPTKSSGASSNETKFVTSYLRGEKSTLLFKNRDIVNGHRVKLIEMFPLNFPFGWGGPNKERLTNVLQQEILRHYSQIALPQMLQSQFLLVICSI